MRRAAAALALLLLAAPAFAGEDSYYDIAMIQAAMGSEAITIQVPAMLLEPLQRRLRETEESFGMSEGGSRVTFVASGGPA